MAALEELKKKLSPLFDPDKGLSAESTLDPCDSYMVSFSLLENLAMPLEGFLVINYLFCEALRWRNG